MFFINAIYWLWIVFVPTGILGLLGFWLYNKPIENLPYSILLTLVGFVLGVLWAERIRKKEDLSFYFSRIMATPDLDEKKDNEKDKQAIKAAPKDSL